MADQKKPRVIPPVRLIYDVTSMESRALIGRAHQAMAVLERIMELDGLDQLSYRVVPYTGAMIVCSKVYGARQIRIFTGGKGPPVGKKERECACSCNFTTGFILEVEQYGIDKDTSNITPLYTVMACFAGRTYVLHEHVLASDFTKYEVGEKVILAAYNEMDYLCCSTPLGATGCRPVRSDVADIYDQAWRSTFRILPWCAITLPKWREKTK